MIEDTNFIDKFLDWEKFDATSQISKRINGVTKEAVIDEVTIWEKTIKTMIPLDYQEIHKEISSWDISVPSAHALTYENIAATYARLVSYKLRVSNLLSAAKAWRDTAETGMKYVEELAQGAFTGTAVEKKANAAYVVQPFVHLKVHASRLENYLEKIHSSIMFCAQQIDLLIKEKQSIAKLNFKLGQEGELVISNQTSYNEEEEVIEEDGEIWTPIQKSNRNQKHSR